MISARVIRTRRCSIEKGVTVGLRFKPSPIPHHISEGEVCCEISLVLAKGTSEWVIELDACLNSADTTLSQKVRDLLVARDYDAAVAELERCAARIAFISDVTGNEPVTLEGELQIICAFTPDGQASTNVSKVFVAGGEVSADIAWLYKSMLKNKKVKEAVRIDID